MGTLRDRVEGRKIGRRARAFVASPRRTHLEIEEGGHRDPRSGGRSEAWSAPVGPAALAVLRREGFPAEIAGLGQDNKLRASVTF